MLGLVAHRGGGFEPRVLHARLRRVDARDALQEQVFGRERACLVEAAHTDFAGEGYSEGLRAEYSQ
eukprot:3228854-Rhodomonas_salina.2